MLLYYYQIHYLYYKTQVAWSVRGSSGQADGTYDYSVIAFPRVDFDIGNVWRAANNSVVVPIAGLYYVHVDVTTCLGCRLSLNLLVNNVTMFNIQLNTNMYNSQSRNQASILQLSVQDELTVGLFGASYEDCVCIDFDYSTQRFYGFLLSPHT